MSQNENRALQQVNHSNVIIWSIDEAGNFINCEGKSLTDFGIKSEEIVGKNIFELFKNHPKAIESVKSALSGEEVEEDHRLGQKCYMNHLAPIWDDQNNMVGVSGISTDITRRKNIETAGEKLMKLPLDMICVGNFDGYFTEVNPGCEVFLGYTSQEMTEKPFTSFIHSEDAAEMMKTIDSLRSGEILLHFENRFRHKNGSYRVLEWTINAEPENNSFYAMARDITERKNAAEALQKIIDTIPQQIWSATPTGEVDYLSQRFLDYTNTKNLDELKGWKWLSILHPDDVERVKDDWGFCIKNGMCFSTEYRFKTKTGDYHWLLVQSNPLLDENGKIVKYYGTCTDIEKEKNQLYRAEEERMDLIREQAILKEREYYLGMSNFLGEATRILGTSLDYHQALDNLTHFLIPRYADWGGITVITREGNWERISALHKDPEKHKLLEENLDGLPRAVDLITKDKKSIFRSKVTEEIVYSDTKDKRLADLALKLGIKSSMIVPIIHRDKVLGSITLIKATDESPFTNDDLSLIEELARRVGTSIENAFLYESAKEAIESRDNFISMASHELKTPLSSLKLQLQMTQRNVHPETGETIPAPKLMQALDNSSEYVNKLNALVEDLLDVTRIESGRIKYNFELIDLSEVTKNMVERYRPQMLTQGSTLSFETTGSVMVKGDSHRLEQVVINLLTNAGKYGSKKPVDVKVYVSRKEAIIDVIDHGIGIPREKLGTVFNRFERVEEKGGIGGLGLGLFISKEIVKAHHGRILVESTPGMGSTFSVHLPLGLKH